MKRSPGSFVLRMIFLVGEVIRPPIHSKEDDCWQHPFLHIKLKLMNLIYSLKSLKPVYKHCYPHAPLQYTTLIKRKINIQADKSVQGKSRKI
jgi:hypothetical protein